MNHEAARPQRALVTGATGYIGSNLVKRLLKDGWEVHIVLRAKSDITALPDAAKNIFRHVHNGTTNQMIDLVATARTDVVFHLASCFIAQHTSEDIENLILSNLLFSTQLVEAMAVNKVNRLINTGTSWQHHENADYLPTNLYAATKQAFEDILDYYVDACGFSVTTLALFDTYGPNDPRQKLISLLWKTARSQQPLVMSPGNQLIDIVYITDVLDAYVLAASQQLTCKGGGHWKYGVSSGHPLKLVDLVSEFERATGIKLPITWGGRPYRPREVMVPWSKYNSIPGWLPKVQLRDGLLSIPPPR